MESATNLSREKGLVVDLQLEWLDEPGMQITRSITGTDDVCVVVDPRLSMAQVSQACRELGDLGWQILGTWCSILRPSMGPAPVTRAAPTVMGIVTPDLTIRWVSTEVWTLFGWHPDAYIGHSLMEFAHPDQPPVSPGSQIALVRTRDGGFRSVESKVTPVHLNERAPSFMFAECWPAQNAA